MIDPISWAFSWPYILSALVVGYLLGSIPFGLLLTRMAGSDDIRRIGSGNIGATNVLRTGNRGLAALTLVLDGGKGALVVILGGQFGPDIAIVAGAGSFIGHVWPVWLMFRGGKGVATALGILLALSPIAGVLTCLVWLIAAFVFRYSSLAALLALASAPAWLWWLADQQQAEFAVALAVIVWFRHWQNIRRLVKGHESRIRLSSEE